MTSELAQAAAFEEALRDAVAERVVASPLGSAVFNDTLPLVWSLNTLRVERAGATAEEIAAEAERLQREALAPIRESILREWLTEPSEDVVRQVREADRLTAAAGNARHFAVVVDG